MDYTVRTRTMANLISAIQYLCFVLWYECPIVVSHPLHHKHNCTELSEYSVIVDGGSTGSRVRVYCWDEGFRYDSLPVIYEVYSHKIRPGIDHYVHNSSQLEIHLNKLLYPTQEYVPQNKRHLTSLYLMATAGMRVLLEDHVMDMMGTVLHLLKNTSVNPYQFTDRNARILSGEEEGVFAWLAVNHLQGNFDNAHEGNVNFSGVVELGGGSLQITFVPDVQILADKFSLLIGGNLHSLYAHSYLGYGQNAVEAAISHHLIATSDNTSGVIDDPCLLKGDKKMSTDQYTGETFTRHGVGDPGRCMDIMRELFFFKMPKRCSPKPCAIGTVYQPSIPKTQQFFALSAFIPTLKTLGVLVKENTLVPREVLEAAVDYCRKDISAAREVVDSKDDFLSLDCVMGLYIPLVLTEGFGFANDTRQITAIERIKGQNIEWTLGAIIYEQEQKLQHCITPQTAAVSSATATEQLYAPRTIIAILLCVATALQLNQL